MKKFRSLKVLVCILLFTLFTTCIATNVEAAENDILDIKVNFGIDGKYKPSISMPIEIEIKNTIKEEINGELEVLVPGSTGTNSSYNQKIIIGSEETKKVIMPINPGQDNSKIKVKIRRDGNLLVEEEFLMGSKPINYGESIIGVFTDDMKSLEYLKNFKSKDGSSIRLYGSNTVPLTNEILESNYKNLQMVDIIIINNYDSTKFTEESLQGLNTWIQNGGVLLIGGGTSTLNNMSKSFLNVDYSNPKDKWINLKEGGITLKAGTLTGDVGTTIVGDDNTTVATSQKRGNGSIVITSFDLGSKSFYEDKNANNILLRMMEEDLTRKFNDYSYMSGFPYELDSNLNKIPIVNEISISRVIIVLVIFILLASFISYFVLKKINKRGLMWIIIPVLSILFTFIMYNIGKDTSVGDKILNGINIVDVDSEGNGKIDSYISIGNKYRSDLNIQEPDGIKIEHMVNENGNMFMPASGNTEKLELKTIYDGDKTFYEFNDVGALELKKFKIMGREKKVQQITSSLNYLETGLNGKINNPYNVDVEQLIVVFGNNVWNAGALKAGEEYTFNNEMPKTSSGVGGYCNSIIDGYYSEKYGSGKGSSELAKDYKNIMRNINVMRFAMAKGSSKPYVIALTNENLDYGLSFEKEDISKYSQTCYVSDIEIGLLDSEGNTVYPLGYFAPHQESAQDGVHIDSTELIAWGKGEAVLNYNFPDKFIPSMVKIKALAAQESDKGREVGPFKGTIEIYNYKTEKFEKLSYLEEDGLEITNLTNYIAEGTLKMKYICNDEEGAKIPTVGVKGRFKK